MKTCPFCDSDLPGNPSRCRECLTDIPYVISRSFLGMWFDHCMFIILFSGLLLVLTKNQQWADILLFSPLVSIVSGSVVKLWGKLTLAIRRL